MNENNENLIGLVLEKISGLKSTMPELYFQLKENMEGIAHEHKKIEILNPKSKGISSNPYLEIKSSFFSNKSLGYCLNLSKGDLKEKNNPLEDLLEADLNSKNECQKKLMDVILSELNKNPQNYIFPVGEKLRPYTGRGEWQQVSFETIFENRRLDEIILPSYCLKDAPSEELKMDLIGLKEKGIKVIYRPGNDSSIHEGFNGLVMAEEIKTIGPEDIIKGIKNILSELKSLK